MNTFYENPLRHIYFQHTKPYGKARCELGWNWFSPKLPDYDLWYVVAGKGEMHLDNHTYSICKGSCFLIRPGDRPQATQDPEDRLIVIFVHFDVISTEGHIQDDLMPARYHQIEDTFYFEFLLNRILDLLYQNELWKEVEFDCILKQILFHLYRNQDACYRGNVLSKKQMHMIAKVINYLQETGGRRVPHEKLASLVGLSPQYLSVIFKKQMGISLKEYITQVRLQRALHLLTETTMNVSQVAEALGYANVYFFSKQFKSYYGASPSQFLMKTLPSESHR